MCSLEESYKLMQKFEIFENAFCMKSGSIIYAFKGILHHVLQAHTLHCFSVFLELTFFGGCVPHRFKNVGSREQIFLEKWGLGNKNFEKFGSKELEFWPKHG